MKVKDIAKEERNKAIIEKGLEDAKNDFSLFFKTLFVEDVDWTIAGHGPVAKRYNGIKQLFEQAEEALFARFSEPLRIHVKGLWADEDKVFAWIESQSKALDGQPYKNCYMYIMVIENDKVVSGIEWLDLDAYYNIVNRIKL